MKARSKEAIESAGKDCNRAGSYRYWPKDNGYFLSSERLNLTVWCGACKKSWRRHPIVQVIIESKELENACPHCFGPLDSSWKRPVPWSKKGRKWARRAKYKRE